MTAACEPEDVLDSLFHGCALIAHLDQAAEEGRFPPDREATRRRAYRYYEEELARKHAEKPTAPVTAGRPPSSGRSGPSG